MRTSINKIIILLIIAAYASTRLVIVNPPSLKKFFADKYAQKYGGTGEEYVGIPYSIANYGDIPYGKSIVGELALPSVLENCVYEDIPSTNKTKKIILS